MPRRVKKTVFGTCVFFFISVLFGVDLVAGEILSRIEILQNGAVHHIFTNGNVNTDRYTIAYVTRYYDPRENNVGSRETVSSPTANVSWRSPDGSTTKHGAQAKMRRTNPNDERFNRIVDKIQDLSGSLSNNLLTRKYQLREIDALNKTLRALAPMTSYGSGPASGAQISERQYEIEEPETIATQTHGRIQSRKNSTPRSVLDVTTGRQMIPAAGGVIDPGTGTFHVDVGAGYVNSKTGAFGPKISP